MLFLHGWGGSAHTREQFRGPDILAELIKCGAIPGMITAAPDGKNSGYVLVFATCCLYRAASILNR
jgi:hypothetical protein